MAIVDIAPSLGRFLGFELPRDVLWEQDGIPFIGDTHICDLKAIPYDNKVTLSWRTLADAPVEVYAAATNDYNTGGKDSYLKLADLPAGADSFEFDLKSLPDSKFYKFVVVTPSNHLNRWLKL